VWCVVCVVLCPNHQELSLASSACLWLSLAQYAMAVEQYCK